MIGNDFYAPPCNLPCGLAIGFFDGVHLGHQALIKKLREKLPHPSRLAVFTFSTHPSTLFSPQHAPRLICSASTKSHLLSSYGADLVLLSAFTPELAATPFDAFLRTLKKQLNFTQLMLGQGATFGKHRQGDEIAVRKLASTLGFEIDYLPKISREGQPLSSRRIRSLIQQGHFAEVSACLGRPYSLEGTLIPSERGSICPLPGLCLPPAGSYPITLQLGGVQRLVTVQVDPVRDEILIQGADAAPEGSEIKLYF